ADVEIGERRREPAGGRPHPADVELVVGPRRAGEAEARSTQGAHAEPRGGAQEITAIEAAVAPQSERRLVAVAHVRSSPMRDWFLAYASRHGRYNDTIGDEGRKYAHDQNLVRSARASRRSMRAAPAARPPCGCDS